MLVIGKNPILEILRTDPGELNKIILLKTLKPEPRLKEIVKLAEENKIMITFLNHFQFTNYFDNKNKSEGIDQGVIGFAKDFEYTTLKDMIDNIGKIKYPLIVLLDEITDPQNLGAIIRSAACLAADGIVIPRHNSADINHTVFKASSGAVKHIPIAKETNLTNSILYLKDKGFWIIGADLHTNKNIFEMDFKMPVGLVIGSEGKGMRSKIKNNCDFLVRIPMTGKLNSLNASVTSAIFFYEIFRQKNKD
jgi:23S rRNA (guanosine2251-2'-O)-methyltransferase